MAHWHWRANVMEEAPGWGVGWAGPVCVNALSACHRTTQSTCGTLHWQIGMWWTTGLRIMMKERHRSSYLQRCGLKRANCTWKEVDRTSLDIHWKLYWNPWQWNYYSTCLPKSHSCLYATFSVSLHCLFLSATGFVLAQYDFPLLSDYGFVQNKQTIKAEAIAFWSDNWNLLTDVKKLQLGSCTGGQRFGSLELPNENRKWAGGVERTRVDWTVIWRK